MKDKIAPWLDLAGKLLLGFSPLALALVFFGLVLFVNARSGLDGGSWNDADRKGLQAVTALVNAEAAAVKAKAALAQFKPTDPKLAAEAELAEAQKTLVAAKAVADKPLVSKTAAEISLRLFWGIACVSFSFLMVLTCIQAIRATADSWRCTAGSPDSDPAARQRHRSVLTLLVIASIVAWVLPAVLKGKVVLSDAGGAQALQLLQALQGTRTELAEAGDEVLIAVQHLGEVLNFMNSGVAVAILLVALSVSTLVWQLQDKLRLLESRAGRTREKSLLEADAQWLREIKEKAAPLMLLITVALIAGVIEVLLMYLLASHHVRPTLQPDARLFAQVIALAGGMIYSGILLAIYLPLYDGVKSVGTLLSARLGIPAAQGNAMPAPDSGSPFDLIPIPLAKSVLTLLAPVFVALGGGLIGTLREIVVSRMAP